MEMKKRNLKRDCDCDAMQCYGRTLHVSFSFLKQKFNRGGDFPGHKFKSEIGKGIQDPRGGWFVNIGC